MICKDTECGYKEFVRLTENGESIYICWLCAMVIEGEKECILDRWGEEKAEKIETIFKGVDLIQLLRKQVPAMHIDTLKESHQEVGKCICGTYLSTKFCNYCWSCGQRIDWTEHMNK